MPGFLSLGSTIDFTSVGTPALKKRSSASVKEQVREASEVSSDLPKVADLIAANERTIAALRAHPLLRNTLDTDVHDDLFILRYVLSSNGNVERAARAICGGIQWRATNSDLLSRVEDLQDEVRNTIATGMLPWSNSSGQPVQFTTPFGVPFERWGHKSDRWHFEAGISNRETAFRTCDRLTRESGRLVKLVMIQDASGMSLSILARSRALANNQGKLSKLSEQLYPQLIDTIVITRPPSFLGIIHSMAQAVMSERVMSKFKVARDVGSLSRMTSLAPEAIPRCLGGAREWDAAWVPIAPDGTLKPH